MGKEILVIAGAAFMLIAITNYIKDTLKGKTKPNRITWLLWALAPMIAFSASATKELTWSLLPAFMSGFGPLLVFIVSFINPNSYWELKPFDYLCGLLSLIALILWAITKDTSITIGLAILSDGLAALPTIIKSWKDPNSETLAPFVVGMFSGLAGLMIVTQWIFSEFAFNIYLIIVNFTISSAILTGRKKQLKYENKRF